MRYRLEDDTRYVHATGGVRAFSSLFEAAHAHAEQRAPVDDPDEIAYSRLIVDFVLKNAGRFRVEVARVDPLPTEEIG